MKRLIAMLLTFAMLMSFMSMSAFAAENEPDTGIITEDITWEDGAVINGATIKGDVTISVKGTVIIAGTIRMATDSIHKVTIKGETEDAKLIRGNDFTGQMFYAVGSICYFQDLIFKNITLDGGAVWTGDVDPILNRGTTNEGIKATGSILHLVRANATLNNCTLQNQDDSTGEKGNAVFLQEYASIAFNDSIVRNNNSPSGYWKGGVVATRYGGIVTAKNSEVCGNSASYGGFVGISSSGSYGTKVECVNTKIHHNYASTAGAAFYLQDNGSKIAKTHGDNGAGYLKLTGCTLENNGSPDGLIYSYVYYMPAWIKDTTIENNDCAVYTYHSDNRSFSVAGDIKITGSHGAYLFENPIRIFDSLGTSASIPMSEASISQLMNTYGYLATETPNVPYHYNHTGNGSYVLTYEYTSRKLHNITLADLAQIKLDENSGYTNWVLTDVDGNGMLDAVPVKVAPATVDVILVDNFKGSEKSETQAVSNVVENVPVCNFEHEGYYFAGWLREDGTLIKDASSSVILNKGEKLTATWAVARPTVAITPADYVICLKEGQSATLTATIGNQNAENLTYSYQWYRDGAAIEGATNATYTATEAEAGDYVYKCVVTAADDVYGTNTYNKSIVLHYDAVMEPAALTVSGTVYLDDQGTDGYRVCIQDEAGNIICEADSAKGGKFSFQDITFAEEGTYTLTVYQISGGDENVDYDGNVYSVTVTVTQPGKRGELQAKMDVETLDFHNRTNEEAPEESIPLAPMPSDPTDPSESDEEIEDEDVPLASAPANPNEAPKTGDDSGVFKSMIVGAMALVAMAVLVLNKKKYVLG